MNNNIRIAKELLKFAKLISMDELKKAKMKSVEQSADQSKSNSVDDTMINKFYDEYTDYVSGEIQSVSKKGLFESYVDSFLDWLKENHKMQFLKLVKEDSRKLLDMKKHAKSEIEKSGYEVVDCTKDYVSGNDGKWTISWQQENEK